MLGARLMGRGVRRIVLVSLAAIAVSCSTDNSTGPTTADRATSANTPATANQAVARPVALRGTLAGLTGACPTVTFMVDSTSVSTTASTTVTGGGCSDLASGVGVRVVGTPQSDGSVVATSIVLRQPPSSPATARGPVAA